MRARTQAYTLAATTLLAMTVAINLMAQSGDRFSGVWEMNPARSKFDPGPAPKSDRWSIVSGENHVMMVSDGTRASGETFHVTFDTRFDGENGRVMRSGARDGELTTVVKRLDANTIAATTKKGGRVVVRRRWTLSGDGRTLTQELTGRNAQGNPVHNVVVFEKR